MLLKEPTRNLTLSTLSTNRKLPANDSEILYSIHFLRTTGFTWVKILQKTLAGRNFLRRRRRCSTYVAAELIFG